MFTVELRGISANRLTAALRSLATLRSSGRKSAAPQTTATTAEIGSIVARESMIVFWSPSVDVTCS